MSVTEYERTQLFTWFEEHMGKERAQTMMSLLPPVGWGDVATKRDLDTVAERLDHNVDVVAERLDLKIDAVGDRVDRKIVALAERTDHKIDQLGMAMTAELLQLRSDLQRTFVTWLFAAQGGVVALLGVLFAALR